MSDQQQTSNVLGSVLMCAGLLAIYLGERVFGEGNGRTAATVLGALLVVAAFGMRGAALSRAKGDVRGVEQRLLGSYIGIIVALGLYALSTDTGLNLFGLKDDARGKVSTVLTVVWPAVMVVSLAALWFMELVYARMPVAASVELRRVRTAAYAGLTLAFSLVFLLSINYVVTARDVRRDVSYFKTTEPSASTKRQLTKLQAPVKALLFYRKTDDVLAQLEPYFASLAKASPKFSYQVVDSALVPELARKHRVTGNGSVLLVQGEADKEKAQPIKIGNELTDARAQLRKLDGLFQQNFSKLVQAERSVQLTVGHGERNAKQDEGAERGEGTKVLDEVWKRLNLKTTKLGVGQGLANTVPDGSGAVIVMGPQQKFLPEEVQSLLEYVRKGGRLLLMVDPGDDDGLDPLLEGLGVARQPGTLASNKSHMRRKYDNSDRVIVFSNKYSVHPSVTTANKYSGEVATIFISGVGLAKAPLKPQDTLKPSVTFPLRSSADFFRDANSNFDRDATEPEETVNLVAAVTTNTKGVEGRAVVIGDGDFMTDKLAANNGNLMVFIDSLAWLIGNEELNAEVSNEEDIPIEHTRDKDKLYFYATTFAVPMPLLGLGLWVARRRRRSGEKSS
ncbi:MAG TPA: DUF4350 domain-containing protein [Polyangiales bacterium]|nr:DUF4350 domain-containing protein [Polyangiales bacterium]